MKLSDEELGRLRGELGCMAFSQSGGGFLDAGILADLDGALGELLSLRSAGRWIPVTPETMPPRNEIVLLWDQLGAEIEAGWLAEDANEVAVFRLERTDPQDELIEYGVGRVTHWQPLPAPPEGKKE